MASYYRKILKKIENTITANCLIEENDRVLVALSGGGDSVFLLHALADLKEKYGFYLAAAHLNHSLREEADAEENFASSLCDSLGIKIFTKKTDVARIAETDGLSCETAGRRVRYAFFDDLKREYHFNKIATAHHLDDNAETILMHFIRGSGSNGLKGIEYSRPDGIIRPLLDITKQEILECLSIQNWEYATDKSNFEAVYTRNRVRLELIPEILKYNPNFSKVITQNAALFAEDENFINMYTKRIFMENYKNGTFPKSVADEQPRAVKRRLIQMIYRSFLSSGQNLSQAYINSVLALSSTGQSVSLPRNVRISLSYDMYVIEKNNDKDKSYEYKICPNKELYIPQIKKRLLVRDAKPSDKKVFSLPKNSELTVRTRHSGDYFYPVGMTGKKTLSDFFTDKKIPRAERDLIPILTADGEIVNIGGLHRDRRFYETTEKDSLYCLDIY